MMNKTVVTISHLDTSTHGLQEICYVQRIAKRQRVKKVVRDIPDSLLHVFPELKTGTEKYPGQVIIEEDEIMLCTVKPGHRQYPVTSKFAGLQLMQSPAIM